VDPAKPRFDGVVNGTRLYAPDATDEMVGDFQACLDTEPAWEDPSAGAHSDLRVEPGFAPGEEVQFGNSWNATFCGGQLVGVVREWTNIGPLGGNIAISRVYGGPEAMIDAPEDKVEACTVRGLPAVCVEPLLPNGFGTSYIIIDEEFGITRVQAGWVSFDLVLEVVESLQ
jgi:hypothetical protein